MLTQQESELLSAYIDNELNDEELAHVQSTLETYVEWREALKTIQKTKTLSAYLPLVPAPADLLDSLEKKAHATVAKNKFSFMGLFSFPRRTQMWVLSGSFAAVSLCVFSIGAYRHHQNSFIPLEPLLAAHARSSAGPTLPQQLNTGSHSSSLVNNYENN